MLKNRKCVFKKIKYTIKIINGAILGKQKEKQFFYLYSISIQVKRVEKKLDTLTTKIYKIILIIWII